MHGLLAPRGTEQVASQPFQWIGIYVKMVIPANVVEMVKGKLQKAGLHLETGQKGAPTIVSLPLTSMSEMESGVQLATALIPAKLVRENGALREGCYLMATIAEFGGKPLYGGKRTARVICGPGSEPLTPLRLTPKEEQKACGESALFRLRPGEPIFTVDISGEDASNEPASVHEFSLVRQSNVITLKAKSLPATQFGRAAGAAQDKFHCDGSCTSSTRYGCKSSHFYIGPDSTSVLQKARKQTYFSPKFGRNSGQCRNCPRTHGQHDPKTQACPT